MSIKNIYDLLKLTDESQESCKNVSASNTINISLGSENLNESRVICEVQISLDVYQSFSKIFFDK